MTERERLYGEHLGGDIIVTREEVERARSKGDLADLMKAKFDSLRLSLLDLGERKGYWTTEEVATVK